MSKYYPSYPSYPVNPVNPVINIITPLSLIRDYLICIRNKKSGLVLDTSQRVVSLQPYNGMACQLWKIKDNLIISQFNGYVLDIEGAGGSGSPIITHPSHGRTNQVWYFNWDGTVSSAHYSLVLDVRGNDLSRGAVLCAFERKSFGAENQIFEVVRIQ